LRIFAAKNCSMGRRRRRAGVRNRGGAEVAEGRGVAGAVEGRTNGGIWR
jgi:hypothetical protein